MDRQARADAVAVILLAAGGSRRLGHPKQLLPFKGRTLLRHAAEIVASIPARTRIVVLGHEAQKMQEELRGLPLQVVLNPSWTEGASTSIGAAVRALPGSVDAALFLLCDQPMISTALVTKIVETWTASRTPIVACAYGGTAGAPALFARSLFGELLALTGDVGAKHIIAAHTQQASLIPFPEGTIDIDTQQDYDTSNHF